MVTKQVQIHPIATYWLYKLFYKRTSEVLKLRLSVLIFWPFLSLSSKKINISKRCFLLTVSLPCERIYICVFLRIFAKKDSWSSYLFGKIIWAFVFLKTCIFNKSDLFFDNPFWNYLFLSALILKSQFLANWCSMFYTLDVWIACLTYWV